MVNLLKSRIIYILKLSFPEKFSEIKDFNINIVKKELKTKHGDYRLSQRNNYVGTINIFNLSFSNTNTILTCLHEISHHVVASLYLKSGHDKDFYKTYKKIIETAIEIGFIEKKKIFAECDYSDITVMERLLGSLNSKYNPEKDNRKDFVIISVKNSFKIRFKLSSMGYDLDEISKSWYKEIQKKDLDSEKTKLLGLIDEYNILISSSSSLSINTTYYIVVSGEGTKFCYKTLKDNGYHFNWYGYDNNQWTKKIDSGDLEAENKFLSQFKKIRVDLKNKSNIKNKARINK